MFSFSLKTCYFLFSVKHKHISISNLTLILQLSQSYWKCPPLFNSGFKIVHLTLLSIAHPILGGILEPNRVDTLSKTVHSRQWNQYNVSPRLMGPLEDPKLNEHEEHLERRILSYSLPSSGIWGRRRDMYNVHSIE